MNFSDGIQNYDQWQITSCHACRLSEIGGPSESVTFCSKSNIHEQGR